MDAYDKAVMLVEKFGISFEEAEDALRRTNYDLLEAMYLIDKRRDPSQRSGHSFSTSGGIMDNFVSSFESKHTADAETFSEFINLAARRLRQVFQSILNYSVIMYKDGRVLIRLPAIAAIILIICTAGFAAAAILVSIVCGCGWTVERDDEQNKKM